MVAQKQYIINVWIITHRCLVNGHQGKTTRLQFQWKGTVSLRFAICACLWGSFHAISQGMTLHFMRTVCILCKALQTGNPLSLPTKGEYPHRARTVRAFPLIGSG